MRTVEIDGRGKTAVVRLNNGVTNAINPQLIEDLHEAALVVRKEFRGMVLTGGDKFFCIGFDLPTLIQLNRTGMSDFFNKFNDLALDLFTIPVPTCCAVTGHATAGGCVLALTGDYRFAAEGKKVIGLNEIKLGVPAPYLADLILRQIVGDRAATEMLYGGEYVTITEARDTGLVDDLSPLEEVVDKAAEKVSQMAGLPKAAFSAIKANRVKAIEEKYHAGRKATCEFFLDCWFTKPVQELLKEASLKFSKS